MIKRVLIHLCTIVLLTALQTTWLHIPPVVPNLLLVFSLLFGLLEGAVVGGVYALVCGIFMDAFSGGPGFLNTLLFLYTTIGIGLVSNRVISKTPANGILLTTAFSMVYFLAYYCLSLLIWGESYSFTRFLLTFFAFALYNAVAATIFFFPIRKCIRHMPIQ